MKFVFFLFIPEIFIECLLGPVHGAESLTENDGRDSCLRRAALCPGEKSIRQVTTHFDYFSTMWQCLHRSFESIQGV